MKDVLILCLVPGGALSLFNGAGVLIAQVSGHMSWMGMWERQGVKRLSPQHRGDSIPHPEQREGEPSMAHVYLHSLSRRQEKKS